MPLDRNGWEDDLDQEAGQPQRGSWSDKIFALSFAILAFVLGLILVVFPWIELWHQNYVTVKAEWLRIYWLNPYLRGAVSGLGVLNLYISILELLRLRRFSSD
jgi:hypothetical protein